MTSRNLCFKLMREDLKRRIWVIAWSVLSTFFCIVVPAALRCGHYKEQMELAADASTRLHLARDLADTLMYGGSNYAYLFLLAGVTTVLWAVSGFHYLHNSRKTDFYHSLPVKRHQLFLAVFLNGIWVPLVCYLAGEAVAVAMVTRAGAGPELYGTLPWVGVLLNSVYYCLLYATVTVAMMMTGNVVVALLGTAVFCGYGPAAVLLIRGYCETWFRTFYDSSATTRLVSGVMRYSSPLSGYVYAVHDFTVGRWKAYLAVPVLLAAAALAVQAYVLYRFRPSETAGRAMAFPKTKAPIRFLLTVPVSVASGIFFYELRGAGAGWLIFGTVCGAVLMHCLMEIIYHFDFRKLFSHRVQLAACTAVCLGLSLAGYFDWFGYDSWVPDAEKVVSAAVDDNYDSWVSYGSPRQRDENDPGARYFWVGETGYALSHMELADLYPVLEIARKGAEVSQNGRGRGTVSGKEWTSCVLKYRMKNGREIYRRYDLPLDDHMREVLASLRDSEEYKMGKYPVLSQTGEETAEVYFQQYNRIRRADTDSGDAARLLEAFRADMEELTIGTREREMPIATIQFRTADMVKAIDHNRTVEDNWYEQIEDHCYYPVYPSFERTLAILREKGLEPEKPGAEILENVQINYDEYSYGDGTGEIGAVSITDPEEIEELAPAMLYQDYFYMNADYQGQPAEGVLITAARIMPETEKGEEKGTETEYDGLLYFYLDLNRLSPETVAKYSLVPSEEGEGTESAAP